MDEFQIEAAGKLIKGFPEGTKQHDGAKAIYCVYLVQYLADHGGSVEGSLFIDFNPTFDAEPCRGLF